MKINGQNDCQGGSAILEELEDVIEENGTYEVIAEENGVDGYSKVTLEVNVPAITEEKSITSNGVYTPNEGIDGFSKVTVNVPAMVTSVWCSTNGTYFPPSGFDGYSKVMVDVPQQVDGYTIDDFATGNIVGRITCNLSKVRVYAFAYCSYMTEALLPNLITTESNVFGCCYSLNYISIPNLSSVGTACFWFCSSLTTVSLPKTTILCGNCFAYCTSLESVYIGANYSSVCALINKNAFQNTPMSLSSYLGHFGSIYVPASLVDSYKTATNWAAYSNRITAIPE